MSKGLGVLVLGAAGVLALFAAFTIFMAIASDDPVSVSVGTSTRFNVWAVAAVTGIAAAALAALGLRLVRRRG